MMKIIFVMVLLMGMMVSEMKEGKKNNNFEVTKLVEKLVGGSYQVSVGVRSYGANGKAMVSDMLPEGFTLTTGALTSLLPVHDRWTYHTYTTTPDGALFTLEELTTEVYFPPAEVRCSVE